jgi:hypothetical protein
VPAAHGYVLSGEEADGDSAEAWSAGAARLRGRDPLPGDRACFFFPIARRSTGTRARRGWQVTVTTRTSGSRAW